MCFYNEGDWIAEVQDIGVSPADKPFACDECRRRIEIGQPRHTLHQEEHEECYNCSQGECECPLDTKGEEKACCQCETPDYGESADAEWCDDCDRFIKAIEAAEKDAGCPPHASRPMVPQMVESVSEGGVEEAEKYFIKAAHLYPELVESGYLGWLREEMFPSV